MASAGNGDGSEKSDIITNTMKTLRKKFSENGTMDRMREVYERELKNSPSHQKTIERLQKTLSSPAQKSYEEMFLELGGPEFQERVQVDGDLDTLLKELVKTESVMIPNDEKTKIFKLWDEERLKK